MKKIPAIVFTLFIFFFLYALPTQAARHRAPSAIPTISSISPTTHVAGSFNVRTNGTNFTGVQAVAAISTSTGNAVGNTTYVVNSTIRITATVNLPADTYYLRVTTSGGTTNSPNLVVSAPPPTISSISPSAHTAGTFGVTITGTNFTSVQAVSAISNSTGAAVGNPTFGVNSPSQITANVNLSAGTYYLKVATSSGTANSPNLAVSFPAPLPAPTPVPAPPPPAPTATSYQLKSPLPGIVNAGTVLEGVDPIGWRTMWKDNSGVVHIFAPFGGDNDFGGWWAQCINTSTGAHSLITGAPHGSATSICWSPTYSKLYIGSSYYNNGYVGEYDPATQKYTLVKNGGVGNLIGMLQNGKDHKIYGSTQGRTSAGPEFFSYDPNTSAWKNYGAITSLVDAGTNYITFAVDTGYAYVSMPKKNTTPTQWSLWITPTSGTPSWSEWSFSTAGDSSVVIKYDDAGNIFVNRQLSDGHTVLTYYLANGSATLVSPAPTEADYAGIPIYCCPIMNPTQYDCVMTPRYGWQIDDSYLFPVKDTHEIANLRYRQVWVNDPDSPISPVPDWISPIDAFTGPWVPQYITGAIPLPGTNQVMCVGDGYGNSCKFNYAAKTNVPLGYNYQSSYGFMQHPDGEIYVGGYPDTVYRYNPSLPWTMSNTTKHQPTEINKPNPYFINMGTTTLHYRYAFDYDTYGVVWSGGNTTRENPDFGDVMWYNPTTGASGYMFPGWAATGTVLRSLCAAANRTKIVVSANNFYLHVIDVATKTVEGTYNLGTNAYMIDVNGVVIGITEDSKIFRFDPLTRTMLTAPQALGVSGTPFGWGFGGNRMLDKLELGPDGYVWMFVGDSLYRINPTTLAFSKVLDTDHCKIKFANNKTDLLLHYYENTTDFKYIPGILEAVSP